ncbi:YgaP family membrane protein [Brevibacillus ginsengisoli]|uniref:YgaP family membrane protein n=1 Tax=Brevibacillus ginsengisoli TaxID=363854 RepID=UPI003CEC1A24
MQKNVGTIDASIRITLGLLGLAYGIGKMSRRPHRTPWLLMTMSAMKVAEGVTGFCPMLYGMGVETRTEQGMEKAKKKLSRIGDNFMASQLAQFTEAIGEENNRSHMTSNVNRQEGSKQDFDVAEMVSSAIAEAAQPVHARSSQATTTSQTSSRGQTRHVRTRENLRENLRRAKTQATNYKQDENTYPTYS